MSENRKDEKPKENDSSESMDFEIPDEDYLKDLDILNTLEKDQEGDVDIEEIMKISAMEDSEVKKILEDLDKEDFMRDLEEEEKVEDTVNLPENELEINLPEEMVISLEEPLGAPERSSEEETISISEEGSVSMYLNEPTGEVENTSQLDEADRRMEGGLPLGIDVGVDEVSSEVETTPQPDEADVHREGVFFLGVEEGFLKEEMPGIGSPGEGESAFTEPVEEEESREEVQVIDLDKTALEQKPEELVTEPREEPVITRHIMQQTMETTVLEPAEPEVAEKPLDSEPPAPIMVEIPPRTSDVDLRLSDPEMARFKTMITSAETLQGYIKRLEEHEGQIKEKIFQKLLTEYQTRRANIFKDTEFIRMQKDAKKDLHDLKSKKEEFELKLEELKDDLEEIKVRHLVGEYNDVVLAEREEEKKNQISSWSDRISMVDSTISFYQDLLSAEGLKGTSLLEETPEDREEGTQAEEDILVTIGSGLSSLEDLSEEDMPEVIDLSPSGPEEAMVTCSHCGKQTPGSEKFCTKCGAKLKR